MRAAGLVVALTLALTACGDSSPPLAETSTDRLEVEVLVTPDPLVSGQAATFELRVTNVSSESAAKKSSCPHSTPTLNNSSAMGTACCDRPTPG